MGALILSASCVPGPQTSLARPGSNLVWQQYRTSREFVMREIALLQKANDLLYQQTGGRLLITPAFREVTLAWRVDRVLETNPKLQSIEAEHNAGDAGIARMTCLGWADREERQIGLAGDRLLDDERFITVAMHEWLHAVGAHHVLTGNVLAPAPHGTCFNRADAEEVARVLGCEVSDLAMCH